MKSTKQNGITLIALVITIIVLLILAGVSIATLTGQNGILTRATDAKNVQADATVKEAIALLWNEYQLEIKSSNNERVKESTKIASTEITKIQGEEANYLATTASSFWEFLLTDKEVINADGVVDVEKLTGQTLDRGNGTDGATDVYKIERNTETNEYTLKYCAKAGEEESIWNITETSTSGDNTETNDVNIIISKTPETELSGGVLLKVEKIEGLDNIDLNSISIDKLGEDEKKELIKKIDLYIFNINGGNCQDFNEVLEDYCDGDEQVYWERIGDIDSYLAESIYQLIYSGMESLRNYIVINPDGEVSDTYRAYANDTYTFTVKEIGTDKTYQKPVKVTNVDTSMEYYYIGFWRTGQILLLDKNNNDVDFQNAYIIYNGERIDVTSCIREYEGDFYVDIFWLIDFLMDMGKVEDRYEVADTIQTFELVKGGKSYFGDVLMKWEE